MSKVWNEDLIKALVCRQDYYRKHDNPKQYSLTEPIRKIKELQNKIKMDRNGTISNIKSVCTTTFIGNLIRDIIKGNEPLMGPNDIYAEFCTTYEDLDGRLRDSEDQEIEMYANKTKHGSSRYAFLAACCTFRSQKGDRDMRKREIIQLAEPHMTTGSFAPNYRNQDCGGWKVNEALQGKGYLRCVKNGWGNENSYSLTQKGVKLMNLVMAKFPIGSAATVGAGGAGVRVGVGVRGSATGHYTGKVMGGYGGFGHSGLSEHGHRHAHASMGTFPTAIGPLKLNKDFEKDSQDAEQYVQRTIESGEYTKGHVMRVSKIRRHNLHDFCDRVLTPKYGMTVLHSSTGTGRVRSLIITVVPPAAPKKESKSTRKAPQSSMPLQYTGFVLGTGTGAHDNKAWADGGDSLLSDDKSGLYKGVEDELMKQAIKESLRLYGLNQQNISTNTTTTTHSTTTVPPHYTPLITSSTTQQSASNTNTHTTSTNTLVHTSMETLSRHAHSTRPMELSHQPADVRPVSEDTEAARARRLAAAERRAGSQAQNKPLTAKAQDTNQSIVQHGGRVPPQKGVSSQCSRTIGDFGGVGRGGADSGTSSKRDNGLRGRGKSLNERTRSVSADVICLDGDDNTHHTAVTKKKDSVQGANEGACIGASDSRTVLIDLSVGPDSSTNTQHIRDHNTGALHRSTPAKHRPASPARRTTRTATERSLHTDTPAQKPTTPHTTSRTTNQPDESHTVISLDSSSGDDSDADILNTTFIKAPHTPRSTCTSVAWDTPHTDKSTVTKNKAPPSKRVKITPVSLTAPNKPPAPDSLANCIVLDSDEDLPQSAGEDNVGQEKQRTSNRGSTSQPISNARDTAVELVIDKRERQSNSYYTEMSTCISEKVDLLAQRECTRAPITVSIVIEHVPQSDFVWRSKPSGGVVNVLMERKAIRDIVSRSAANAHLVQLATMCRINPQGSNILLLDGDVKEVHGAKVMHSRKHLLSCWDPDVRFFGYIDAQEDLQPAETHTLGGSRGLPTTCMDIRSPEHLLVQMAALITHGGVQVVTTGKGSGLLVQHTLAGYTTALAECVIPSRRPGPPRESSVCIAYAGFDGLKAAMRVDNKRQKEAQVDPKTDQRGAQRDRRERNAAHEDLKAYNLAQNKRKQDSQLQQIQHERHERHERYVQHTQRGQKRLILDTQRYQNRSELGTHAAETAGDTHLGLKFRATATFWDKYVEGVKKKAKAPRLNQSEDTEKPHKRHRLVRGPECEGAHYFHACSREVQVHFETIGRLGTQGEAIPHERLQLVTGSLPPPAYAELQCFAKDLASVRVQVAWVDGVDFVTYVHALCLDYIDAAKSQRRPRPTPSPASAALYVASKFVVDYFPSAVGGATQTTGQSVPAHIRRCLVLNKLSAGFAAHAEVYQAYNTTHSTTAQAAQLPFRCTIMDVVAMVTSILTCEHKVSCLSFDIHAEAYSAMIIQYLCHELSISAGANQMHYEITGV